MNQLTINARYEGSSHRFLVNGLFILSIALTTIDWVKIVKRAIAYRRSEEAHGRSWLEVIKYAADFEAHAEDQADSVGRYEMVGFSDSEGIVFSLGDHEDEDEHRPHLLSRRDNGLQLYQSRSAPSRSSTGSDGTLHEAPLYEEVPISHHKSTLRMGAYDSRPSVDLEHEHGHEHHHVDNASEAEVWRIEETKPTIKRSGEVILTWIRRTQVVIAYVTVLAGFIVYTVRDVSTLTAQNHS